MIRIHSARYGIGFLAIAILEAYFVCGEIRINWLRWAVYYLAFSHFVLAIAYLGVGASLFGKKPNGVIPVWSWIWFGPVYVLNSLAWNLSVAVSSEIAVAEAAPNLFLGRRIRNGERQLLANLGLVGCLDLTVEFSETNFLRSLPSYRSHQILDGAAPTIEQLHDAIDWIDQTTQSGPVYVHCALGHGRTGSILIAYLLAKQQIDSIDEGIELLRSSRFGVDINQAQYRQLVEFTKLLN